MVDTWYFLTMWNCESKLHILLNPPQVRNDSPKKKKKKKKKNKGRKKKTIKKANP